MTYKVDNIIVGAAGVYTTVLDSTSGTWIQANGQLGPNLPSDPTAGSSFTTSLDAASTVWRSVGFTSAGVDVVHEPTFGDIVVDQLLDSARLFKQSLKMMVNTTLAEATLENLLFLWGQAAATLKTGSGAGFDGVTLAAGEEQAGWAAGALGEQPTERGICFVGPAPKSSTGAARERVYHVRRSLNVQSSTFGVKRDAVTMFPASFRILPDPIKSGAEYGTARDRLI